MKSARNIENMIVITVRDWICKDKGINPFVLENQPIPNKINNKKLLTIEVSTLLHEAGGLPHKQNI